MWERTASWGNIGGVPVRGSITVDYNMKDTHSKHNRATYTGGPPWMLPKDNVTKVYNTKEYFDWKYNRKMTVKIYQWVYFQLYQHSFQYPTEWCFIKQPTKPQHSWKGK